MYRPKPIDTSRVTPSPSLRDLIERLAEHNHDVWASRRLSEGWKHGPERNDARKEHPDLVPYAELPESEKAYDRSTAEQVVHALVALGWTIEPPERSPAPGMPQVAGAIRLDEGGRLPTDLLALRGIWDSRSALGPRIPCNFYRAVGDAVLKGGEPLLAYDVLCEGLQHWPDDVRLRQLQGLALARSGAVERATDVFLNLVRDGHDDGETLGLLAGRYKEMAGRASEPQQRSLHEENAFRTYARAYRLAAAEGRAADACYVGINAATLALLRGETEEAQRIARHVRQLCMAESPNEGDPYWREATLAEVALVLREWAEAEDRYARAAQAGRGRFADLGTTRRQACALLHHLGRDPQPIERCLRVPRVVAFAGHMIDQPDRPVPRLPPALEPAVALALDERLAKLDAGFGYASAACGSDILFHEAMLRRGGEIQVVLPFPRAAFRALSVDRLPGADWGERFERILGRAAGVRVTSPSEPAESGAALEYSNGVLDGVARLRARLLESECVHLAVWDGRRGERGGTASLVEQWRRGGRPVEVIDVNALAGRPASDATPAQPDPGSPAPQKRPRSAASARQRIMAMLFADAVGYSKLTERQVPIFLDEFLGAVGDLVNHSPFAPAYRNTWGDGLYLVFSSVADAARFALDLCDRINSRSWGTLGLPEHMNLRIALHAGSVYECNDPVTNQRSFTGAHVSRAARIEPVTPPGEVYASEAFAALAEVAGIEGVACEYVGVTSFAKGYGAFPLYHVRRAAV